MDYYNGDLTHENRYKNELMNHAREQTKLLKQIAQLLEKTKKEGVRDANQPNKGTSVNSPSKRQQGQRGGNSNSVSRK